MPNNGITKQGLGKLCSTPIDINLEVNNLQPKFRIGTQNKLFQNNPSKQIN